MIEGQFPDLRAIASAPQNAPAETFTAHGTPLTRSTPPLPTCLCYNLDSLPPAPLVGSVPSFNSNRFGPAFCRNSADFDCALKIVHTRLKEHPHLSVSIDLEGRLGGNTQQVVCQAKQASADVGGKFPKLHLRRV